MNIDACMNMKTVYLHSSRRDASEDILQARVLLTCIPVYIIVHVNVYVYAYNVHRNVHIYKIRYPRHVSPRDRQAYQISSQSEQRCRSYARKCEQKFGKIWEKLDYHPPPTFRPPTHKRVKRFLPKR
jgi:hypothetical protein